MRAYPTGKTQIIDSFGEGLVGCAKNRNEEGITLDLYSHRLPNMQEEAARRLDEAFRPASSTSQQTQE